LTYTGHSLGGGLASISALNTLHPAVVFNTAAVGTHALFLNSINIVGHESLISTINTTGDPVTIVQNGPIGGIWPAPGTPIEIGRPFEPSNAAEFLHSHSIATVLNVLRNTYNDNCTEGP